MKKILTKFFTLLFAISIFTIGINTSKVSASSITPKDYYWNFALTGVTDTLHYDTGELDYVPENRQSASSSNTYNFTTQSIGVELTTQDYIGTIFANVDGQNIGQLTEISFHQDNYGNYVTTYLIRNLTPGTHEIQIRGQIPVDSNTYNMGYFYAVIPTN